MMASKNSDQKWIHTDKTSGNTHLVATMWQNLVQSTLSHRYNLHVQCKVHSLHVHVLYFHSHYTTQQQNITPQLYKITNLVKYNI